MFVFAVVGAAVLVVRARDRRFRHQSGELNAIKRRLHQGLALPGISIFSVDRAGIVTWFAGRTIAGTSLSMSTATGVAAHDLLTPYPRWLGAVRDGLRGQSTTVAVLVNDTVLEVTCEPIRDDEAQVTEVVVTARDNTEGQAESERAERLAAMRTRALATINHKLRGQLNGMLGVSELLGTTDLDEQQRAWTEIIDSSGQQLLKFVHHLIDYMELDAERFEAEQHPFSLRSTLDEILERQRPRADEAETTLIARYPLDLSEDFSGDSDSVRQVIELLIGVAIGTNAGGEVTVNIEEYDRDADETVMVVAVEDRGRGLTPAALARIFDGLESPSAMWSIRSGGTGLELPIARLLARTLGGDLTVDSRVNVGTTLRLELPLTRASLIELVQHAPQSDEERSDLRILLVDDSEVQSQVAVHLLRTLGHRVTVTHNGAEAIELLDAVGHQIDVMLTELHMPVLDGFATTNAIRQRTDALRELPIIAVTSDTRRATRQQALDAGFDRVLDKPLELDSLRRSLVGVGHRAPGDTTEAPDAAEAVIDEDALARLTALDPDGELRLLEDLASAFLEATPRQLLEARDAAQALNAKLLEPIVRSIATSCRLVGALRMERRTDWLLRATDSGDLAGARSAADALTAEFALVRRALNAALERRAA